VSLEGSMPELISPPNIGTMVLRELEEFASVFPYDRPTAVNADPEENWSDHDIDA